MASPELTEFRLEPLETGIAHLVFDMPGRAMNVFSNRAIHEAEALADWLKTSGLKGLAISSGKATGFCAGADLGELAQAYAMILAAPKAERHALARDHFAPIGRAFRKLETAGVPIAVAVDGLALGGGCEFAMAGHFRVLTDRPETALGLPESLVGLFPGAGGTQRAPRYLGLEAALPVLLDGARLGAAEAVAAGLAHRVAAPGEALAACVDWLRSGPEPLQPWDRPDWRDPSAAELSAKLAPVRAAREAATGGHYPAVTAILECLERGLPLPMDEAVGAEIDIFAHLIQRPEPRDMIASLFLGKQTWQKQRKRGDTPAAYAEILAAIRGGWSHAAARFGAAEAQAAADWAKFGAPLATEAPPRAPRPDLLAAHPAFAPTEMWLDSPQGPQAEIAGALLGAAALAALEFGADLDAESRRAADFAAVSELGFPAYLGGPFALRDSIGDAGLRRLLEPLTARGA